MQVQQYDDILQFVTDTTPFLMQREAEHCLLLGILARLSQTGWRDQVILVIVEADALPLLVAVQTPPYNLVLSVAADVTAIDCLAEYLAMQQCDIPGINGCAAEAKHFAARWQALNHTPSKITLEMQVHQLTQIEAVTYPPGQLRNATADDLELLIHWFRDFHTEALPEPFSDRLIGIVQQQVAAGTLHLWEDTAPVTMVAHHGMPSGNARIGPVYTPPQYRQRGHATATVAQLSRDLLEMGGTACFLFTYITNPASNSIYRKIGYQVVGDYVMMALS